MRISICLMLLAAAPAFAQHKLSHDFRGGQFDADLLRLRGPTPEKYMTPEPEGLRVRLTGHGAPPSWDPACVTWQMQARGDFVVTARYEILKAERPAKGVGVGVELYLMLGNANKDGVAFARCIRPSGRSQFGFIVLTNDANGNRRGRDGKEENTTERSRSGQLRLVRKGSFLTASYAQADDANFTEFQRAEIGTTDIRLFRLTGYSGDDPNAVLDLRLLEFSLEADEWSRDGQFLTPPPGEDVPKAKQEAAPVVPAIAVPPPQVQSAPPNKLGLLMLVGMFFLLAVPAVIILIAWLILRRRSAPIAETSKPTRPSRIRAK